MPFRSNGEAPRRFERGEGGPNREASSNRAIEGSRIRPAKFCEFTRRFTEQVGHDRAMVEDAGGVRAESVCALRIACAQRPASSRDNRVGTPVRRSPLLP